MCALDTVQPSPGSQAITSASAAFLARHQLSATTATASGNCTTRRTPFIAESRDASTDFSRPLNTGHCTIVAYSMSGRRTSMA